MKIPELIAAFDNLEAYETRCIRAYVDRLRADIRSLKTVGRRLPSLTGGMSRIQVAISDERARLAEIVRRLETTGLLPSERRLLAAEFATSAPDDAALIGSYRQLVMRIDHLIQCDDRACAYDGTELQGRLLPIADDTLGIRTFVPSRSADTYTPLIHNNYPTEREAPVILKPGGLKHVAIIEEDEVFFHRPNDTAARVGEMGELDASLARIMAEADRSVWYENAVTHELCMALREARKYPRLFRYSVNGLHVVARLSIHQQRGSAEEHYGDIGLVVERLDLPADHEKRRGVAAIEAKIRGYDDGKIHTIRTAQAQKILSAFPRARLMIYDRQPVFPGAHAICMPLAAYAEVKSSSRPRELPDDWHTFSYQLFVRFFLGDDLNFEPAVVAGGLRRRAYFMEFAEAVVAVGDDPLALERQIEQHRQHAYERSQERTIARARERGHGGYGLSLE